MATDTRPQAKKKHSVTPLIKVEDCDLVGHPALAHSDGYAHGLYVGRMFISERYNKHDKIRYAAGFKQGTRVRKVLGVPRG